MKLELSKKELQTIKYALGQLEFYEDELFIEIPKHCLDLEMRIAQAIIDESRTK